MRLRAFGIVGAKVDVDEAPLEAVGDLRAQTVYVIVVPVDAHDARAVDGDPKSTRLNSIHSQISYAVFCLKKKNSRYRTLLVIHSACKVPVPLDFGLAPPHNPHQLPPLCHGYPPYVPRRAVIDYRPVDAFL